MIPIVRMLPNALGLRPTASAALPPTIPTPIPAPKPANAKGRNGPKFPASAASIGTVSNMISSFRSVVFSFPPPTRDMVSTGKFLVGFRRELRVDSAQHRKDERLQ